MMVFILHYGDSNNDIVRIECNVNNYHKTMGMQVHLAQFVCKNN